VKHEASLPARLHEFMAAFARLPRWMVTSLASERSRWGWWQVRSHPSVRPQASLDSPENLSRLARSSTRNIGESFRHYQITSPLCRGALSLATVWVREAALLLCDPLLKLSTPLKQYGHPAHQATLPLQMYFKFLKAGQSKLFIMF
jgi:hypothetical protein